jgi:hypothetical protein
MPRFPEARPLLDLYLPTAALQQEIFDARLPASLGPAPLLEFFPRLLEIVRRRGPKSLFHAGEATPPTELSLVAFWQGERDIREGAQFFARALLQPWVAMLRATSAPLEHDWEAGESCPFCSAAPAAAVLRNGRRSLWCGLCGGECGFAGAGCTCCGEADESRRAAYRTEDAEHVYADACDTCGTYIKTIDLNMDEEAVPAVEEMVTLGLNLWAEESGYRKREPNLLGM